MSIRSRRRSTSGRSTSAPRSERARPTEHPNASRPNRGARGIPAISSASPRSWLRRPTDVRPYAASDTGAATLAYRSPGPGGSGAGRPEPGTASWRYAPSCTPSLRAQAAHAPRRACTSAYRAAASTVVTAAPTGRKDRVAVSRFTAAKPRSVAGSPIRWAMPSRSRGVDSTNWIADVTSGCRPRNLSTPPTDATPTASSPVPSRAAAPIRGPAAPG
ncbi:hypothetical protein WJ438_29630 [Streptomyces sp. GD-15H]|uniref:hypothetical protein n=1 Tax=Streptomyces sp. GD-15H TaxID=3129112 RepID=UPI00324E97B9